MKVDITKVFPCILIGINAVASFVCFGAGDIKKGIYWAAAAILNATVAF